MFSTLTLGAQFDGLFGAGGCHPLECGRGDLQPVATQVLGQPLIVVGFDYSIQHGSMGAREADQLVEILRRAGQGPVPLVFVMNTSGVRVTEGTAGVAALRRMLQAALDARLSGVRMLAMIARNCFGGASVLAALCEPRIVNQHCLIGMSGPKLIERASGSEALRAGDPETVRRLLGGAARAAVSPAFVLVDDDAEAYRLALLAWLQQPATSATNDAVLSQNQRVLSQRLQGSEQSPLAAEKATSLDGANAAAAASVLGSGYEARRSGDFLAARSTATARAEMYGLVGALAADALHVMRLSDALADVPADAKVVAVLLDCESHSARAGDEKIVLSEYLAHLALQTRTLHHRGVEVRLIVTGVSGGGIFAALASAASKVWITPGGRLRVLPRAAMAAINKVEGDLEGTPLRALQTGAVDELMQDLIARDSIGH